MNRLVAILLLILNEEDSFWGLVAIVEGLMPAQYYDRTMIAAHADQVIHHAHTATLTTSGVARLHSLGGRTFSLSLFPPLSSYLLSLSFPPSFFSFP